MDISEAFRSSQGASSHAPEVVTPFPTDSSGYDPDRTGFDSLDIVRDLWTGLGLPLETLGSSISVPSTEGPTIPSSFKIGHLAQGSIASSGLAAALVHTTQQKKSPRDVPRVTVPARHATVEFQSEKLYTLDGKRITSLWGTLGGLHPTSDGYVRIHDGFTHHRLGALALLGLPPDAKREEVSERTRQWAAIDLETEGLRNGLAIYAVRTDGQWNSLPQAKALSHFPIRLQRIAGRVAGREEVPSPGLPSRISPPGCDKCLRGLRVVELSRVIAAPVAGRTLAVHGADVLWVTSPKLPDLPVNDKDLARGKRTIQLDLDNPADKERLMGLIRDCDVFIQGYRPGSLARRGFSHEALAAVNPGIVCANLSAFGPVGPWAERRGFDSLVQTCSGMNLSEAEHFYEFSPHEKKEAPRPMPCQALDHAAGYLLATGICAALYHRVAESGLSGGLSSSYRVDVSLALVMKYLRSLGQYPSGEGFEGLRHPETGAPATEGGGVLAEDELFEVRTSGFGKLRSVRHSARVEGLDVGWDLMPKPLGSDVAEWLA